MPSNWVFALPPLRCRMTLTLSREITWQLGQHSQLIQFSSILCMSFNYLGAEHEEHGGLDF